MFQNYRVYSTSYDLDATIPLCGTDWRLEGTTVAPEFVAGALTNGISRCFTVTAFSGRRGERPVSGRATPPGRTRVT